MDAGKQYEAWINSSIIDEATKNELMEISDNADEIEERFCMNLEFGTGGLRGIMGAGLNRMNKYTVRNATQGLANYLNKNIDKEDKSVVISYDNRHNSKEYAIETAGCLVANGIKVYIFDSLRPTPVLSFAVRFLGCDAGVNITASHNPKEYNGYKVYGPDGCQITTEAAAEILVCINKLDIFADVKTSDFEEGLKSGKIKYIDDNVLTGFIEDVKNQSVLYGDEINKDVAIVYSPLNGTGLKPVIRVLNESGFTNITIVEEQRNPDGNFPTCPYPNPEIREAMELGLKYCKKTGADLLLATDPDADRCGIAVKVDVDGAESNTHSSLGSITCDTTSSGNGVPESGKVEYKLLSGNEVGLLLLDYICSQRASHGKMSANPVFIKTIVTMDLAEKIAESYGVKTINVLTGFKFIGEQIGLLEKAGRADDFICGFEESYGYLTGSYVRDKDAVNAAFMICEMFAFYKTRGISLIGKLQELYQKYGYCLNTLHSFEFPGSSGMQKMADIMAEFHKGLDTIAGMKVVKTEDYSKGLNGLPKSDVLKFYYYDGELGGNVSGSVVVRPSGTEPKLKTYISVTAENKITAEKIEKLIQSELSKILV